MAQRTCCIDGCDRPHEARGWCKTHYARWRANGDPLAVKHVHKHPSEGVRRVKAREAKRRWRLAHPEKMAAARAAWEAANPETRRRYRRERKKRDPVSNRAYVRARKARQKKLTVVSFTAEQLRQRIVFFGNRCWMCGAAADTIDHVKPLAKGGAHILCNLRPACTPCNTRKGVRWPYTSSSPGAGTAHAA